MKFEDAEPDIRVKDSNRGWTGVVHSTSGSRSSRGVTKVRTLKVKWANGVTEDFHDVLPKGIELIPWV